MKIGAGGLQSIVMHEITARQSEPIARTKPIPDPVTMQEQEYGKKLLNEQELNKSIEKLNNLAAMYNYNINFKLTKTKGHAKVKVRNTKNGTEQEVTIAEFEEIFEKMSGKKGRNIDDYA